MREPPPEPDEAGLELLLPEEDGVETLLPAPLDGVVVLTDGVLRVGAGVLTEELPELPERVSGLL